MGFWINFWTFLLVAALVVFAGLAIVVTIGGFFDIKALFRSIEAKHAEQDENGETDAT